MSRPHPPRPILIVDDEPGILRTFEALLNQVGFDNILPCAEAGQVLGLAERERPAAILLDLLLPAISGEELLPALATTRPETPVIVVTGSLEVERAVRCMKAGAFDYLVKPVEEAVLTGAVRRAVEVWALKEENRGLRERLLAGALRRPEAFRAILTVNPRMLALFNYLEAIAPSSAPILVTGETGVGKELIARAVHDLSGRSGRFVAVNMAGLDDALFSDTLFGHGRGAFTGAEQARAGLVAAAAGGTLFLDEIGDLAPASQAKLLRLLQEGEYLPLGRDQARQSQARVVAATNQDLTALQRADRFRADLAFRLKAFQVHVPPLRERLEDLPLLLDHLLDQAATVLDRPKPRPPAGLGEVLARHPFPGNVRELQAMVFEAVSRYPGEVLPLAPFQAHLAAAGPVDRPGPAAELSFPERLPGLREYAGELVAEALRRCRGNQSQAARLLGVSPQALSKRLRKKDRS